MVPGYCGVAKSGWQAQRFIVQPLTHPPVFPQKPDSWRLACQTIVGDGDNTGRVTITTKPQQ